MTRTRSSLMSIHNMEIRNRSLIIAILILLIATGYFTEQRLKHEIETSVRDSLEKNLRSNAEAMKLLLTGYKERVHGISKLPLLKRTTLTMASKHDSNDKTLLIKNTKILESILEGFFSKNGFLDYYLISPDGHMIATLNKELLGHQVNTKDAIESLMDRDGNFVCLPKKAIQPNTGEEFVLMYIGSSLKDNKGETYAYLAFSINPSHGFSSIMEVTSQTGESSETYAINNDGWMISHSRFDAELRELEILDEKAKSSVLEVKLINEEGQALTVFKDAFSNPATAYPQVQVNSDGYRDYRDSEVVGSWTYLPQYNFAITSEIDKEEAFRSLFIIRIIFGIIFGLASLLAIGLIAYALYSIKLKKKVRSAALDAASELGQFKIIEKIGEGAMGVVYKAKHQLMQRETAIKVLKNEVCRDVDLIQFEKEVRITCRLTHPNTICIYDYGKTREGLFYYAMEYLEGSDIQEIISKTGPIAPERVVHFVKQICASLNEAHQMGLIHRDIKAQNIVVCNRGGIFDSIKVLDFGLVHDANDDNGHKVSGTPRYMAPEASSSRNELHESVDTYAIGILICVMLTGQYPFACEENVEDILKAHRENVPLTPSELVKFEIPKELDPIVLWCLEKDPKNRPASVAALASKLDELDLSPWTQDKAQKWWAFNGEYFLSNDGSQRSSSSSFDQTIQFDRFDKTIQTDSLSSPGN
ncbi:serine/threonine protein kinase [Lentisphaera profundi]|uniref:Serine/threonine protein kinase n=1 Tax=Lentisphaera profundi TaxID=1658616 RepID=A0ABY7VW01_9BACT|nr:serine/threonine protein kinase [Lentisphaera profundi]WDE98403.1 serine/threonine protein kinase [Lentisphaera profundi]